MKDGATRKVHSFKPQGCTIGRVKELLNIEKTGWDDSLLQQLFTEADI